MSTLTSFRELLMKRADGVLKDLVKIVGDDFLVTSIIESLQKMAKPRAHNHAILGEAGHVLPHDADAHPHDNLTAALVHDNLSHHLSNYKSALGAGNRAVADQHLGQVMKTMRLAHKLGSATEDKIRLRSGVHGHEGGEGSSVLSLSPWEMNYTGSDRRKPDKPGNLGKFHEDQKGLGRQLFEPGKGDMFPDYRYLEMSPHPHANVSPMGHTGAYPFHDLQVNGKFVHLDDTPHSGQFEPHPFDTHPAMKHAHDLQSDAGTRGKKMSVDDAHKFVDDHKAWLQGPEMESWLTTQEQKHEDPLHFFRGEYPGESIHSEPTPNPHDLGQCRRATSGEMKHPYSDTGTASEAPAPVEPDPSTTVRRPAGEVSSLYDPRHHAAIKALAGAGDSPDKIARTMSMPVEHVLHILRSK